MRLSQDNLVYLPTGIVRCDLAALRSTPSLAGAQELPEMTDVAGLLVTSNGCGGLNSNHLHHNLNQHQLHLTHHLSNGSLAQSEGSSSPAAAALTVRMIMQGKEVGSIIGKKGDNIKKFREESGAKINISDGSCPERIVTVTGSAENIHRAFDFISRKFEEDLQNTLTTPKPPVTLRLVVPASQCGSLIGKQGSKIKEIRESTGASIQVASEMLPNSTERAVTVSGTAEAVTQCVKYVCGIMMESPPKGANLPYRPKPMLSPVYITGGQGFTMPATLTTLPAHELPKGFPHPIHVGPAIPVLSSAQTMVPGSLVPVNGLGTAVLPSLWSGHLPPTSSSPCISLGGSLQYSPRPANPSSQHSSPGQQAQEMNIPNDLIGCIIGRGGQKINEIRQVSGATIKISNAENGLSDRKITISGSPECIGLAQYLISSSMKLHKTLTLDPASLTPVSTVAGSLPPLPSHPVAMTVVKPLPPPGILGLSGMHNLNSMTSLVDPTTMSAQVAPASVALATFVGGKPLQTKMRLGLTSNTAFRTAERPKFSPY